MVGEKGLGVEKARCHPASLLKTLLWSWWWGPPADPAAEEEVDADYADERADIGATRNARAERRERYGDWRAQQEKEDQRAPCDAGTQHEGAKDPRGGQQILRKVQEPEDRDDVLDYGPQQQVVHGPDEARHQRHQEEQKARLHPVDPEPAERRKRSTWPEKFEGLY